MSFQFPNTPGVGARYYPVGGPVYEWNGYAWRTLTSDGGGGGGGGIPEAPLDGEQYARQTGDWEVVVTGGGGGIPEAPLDGQQYARQSADWEVVVAGGGGGDLDTTPVAAVGSTLARTMPQWLAGAPVIEIPGDITILPEHRGAWLHMMNAVGSTIYLVNNWAAGMSFGARQIGTGTTQWILASGASQQLPFTRLAHVGISEQYEEVIFRVISNPDGTHAVWGVSGATG